MAKPVARLGDVAYLVGEPKPHKLIMASTSVLVNSIGAGRLGDEYEPHLNRSKNIHTGIKVAVASSSVLVNGKGVARLSLTLTSENGKQLTASQNVEAG